MPIQTDKTTEPLAIIGMGCRLPGAANLEEYWRLIYEGRSAVAEVPAERLNQELYYDPRVGVRGKTYCKLAALLQDRRFDAERCPLPDELTHAVDATHLLMTGVAAEALRHAHLDPFNLPDRNTGVFIGHAQGSTRLGELIFNAYLEDAIDLLESTEAFRRLPAHQQAEIRQEITGEIQQQHPPVEEHARNLNCNMVSGTIARAFGLTGQWLALNSACASSLHAMLLGARALQRGRADMVIVGGASDCKSDSLVLFSHAQAMSSKATRPFDAEADGLIMSEGYVALVMKTLERAIADGNPIQAVVRGLGVATDGRGKSLWAPRKEGQMKAMRRAYRSGVEISKLQYLECHATATQLGDATELETLGQVLCPNFPEGKRIPITSVKANIGHSLEAAGMAGLIKTVLCMQRQAYPPAINVTSLNPKVDWDTAPFYIPLQPGPWQPQPDGSPRRAAVNAFGIGGLNMHVVLDEYTPTASPAAQPRVSAAPETAEDRAIAVVGMSCIVPGAEGLPEFWQLLMSGRDPKMPPPEDRWTQRALARAQQRSTSPRGGFISDYQYDWRKNKVPPKQVAEADPLQFMLLDASERALDDAGYDRASIDRELCGVVIGTEFGGDFSDHLEMGLRLPEMKHVIAQSLQRRGYTAEQVEAMNGEFEKVLLKKWPSLVDETGSFTSSTLASRISKTLDLAGGAVSIDSGGTSAMSSLSICIDMLLSGDNDLMICAAGQRRMGSSTYEQMEKDHLLDTQGTPRSILDAQYHGIVPGEGVGAVVLKRLSDARRDGDRIHAIIRGLGAAHHSSPAEALQLAMHRSCEMAGVAPQDIGFAELDTDEPLDAASEPLRSLAPLYGAPRRERSLAVGSSTAQTGHLGGASAMVALIKASMSLENEQLPAAFAAAELHPALSGSQQLAVNTTPAGLDGRRFGAVVSWAKGQAWHMILEHPTPVAAQPVAASTESVAAPPETVAPPTGTAAPAPAEEAVRILRWGAPTIEQLQAAIEHAQGDVAGSWSSPKAAFGSTDTVRLAIVADTAEQLRRKLKLAQGQARNPSARQVLQQQGIFCHELPTQRPRVAFVFPGQGSQYDGMLRELVRQAPAASRKLEEIDNAMSSLGFPSFTELAWATTTQLGKDVWHTQVSMLLADAIMLAAVQDRGIVPDLVLGHSYGELVALYAAGVWDLETAIVMTKARCDGIVAVASGDAGMLATNAPPEEIKRLMAEAGVQAYLANFNAPDQTTVGGKLAQLESLASVLHAQSFQARLLPVPAAFHTPLMAGSSRLLVQALQTAKLNTPQTAAVSTVDNRLMQDVEHIRRNLGGQLTTPVQYAPLIQRLAAEFPTIFVEVGPQQTLTRLNQRTLADAVEGSSYQIACDNPKRAGVEPLACVQALLECLGALKPEPQKTAAQPPVAPLATPSAQLATPSTEPTQQRRDDQSLMDDQIPHFDATQRRREKMRQASVGVTGPNVTGPNGSLPAGTQARPVMASPPAPPSAPPSAPATPLPGESTRLAPPAAPDRTKHGGNGSIAPSNTSAPITLDAASSPPTSGPPTSAPPTSASPPAATASPAPPAPTPSAAEPATPPAADQDWASFLINFVVEQTGYPPEVVELDADLEADLGIDSIKKAQLFGELQEYFDVGSMEASELSLDDFPTLRHVLNFLQGASTPAMTAESPATAPAPTPPPAAPVVEAAPVVSEAPVIEPVIEPAPAATETPAASSPAVNASEMESFLVNFVVEQTGYPPEVVELDADLEADLGIDSIKKAQLFGELQEYFDVSSLSTSSELSLDDFPTLRHVLNFLVAQGPPPASAPPASAPPASAPPASAPPASPATDAVSVAPAVAPSVDAVEPPSSVRAAPPPPIAEPPPPIPEPPPPGPSDPPAAAPSVDAGQMESFLINFVVEQTGYPPEVVELDADLEADLGIDSIKKAQLFGELQEYFDVGSLSTSSDLSLDDFPTLRHVLNFLIGAGPQTTADPSSGLVESDPNSSSFPSADPAPAMEPNPVELAPAAASSDTASSDTVSSETAELESFLVNFVVEQTGYPAEVVELDADLEADLGIDSIKKAQLFGELQEYFDVGALSTTSELSLDDFPTLRHVLDFLAAHQPAANAPSSAAPSNPNAAAAESVEAQPQAPPAADPMPTAVAEVPLRLEGTPYEMGWQQGQRFKLEIRGHLHRYVEYIGDEWDELPGLDRAQVAPEDVLSADELDELQGLADAVEVPLGNMIAHHFAASADLGSGAGQVVVSPSGNSTGQMIHSLRQPLPTMEALRASVMPTVMARMPSMGIPYLAVSNVGSVSILGGLNAAGVAVTVCPNGTAGQSHHHGTSSIARVLLEHATDLESALTWARSQADGKAWTACISDANSDRVAVAESDGRVFRVRSDETRVLVGDSWDTASGNQSLTAESLLESSESDSMTLVIDAKRREVCLRDDREASVKRVDALPSLPSQFPSEPVQTVVTRDDRQLTLPSQPVASRFVLEMHEADLAPGLPSIPTWNGGAIIVGENATSQALAQRLADGGVRVCSIPASQDIDAALSTLERFCHEQAAPHLFITTARDDLPIQPANEAVWTRQRHETMMLPLFVCQKWIELSTAANWLDQASLVAVVAHGGDFGFERGSRAAQAGAISGLLKAIFIEYTVMQGKNLRVKTVDCPCETSAEVAVEHVFRELASGNLDYEVGYGGDGQRRVPMAVEQQAPIAQASIRPGANWVVTGGSRGITAACALELAKRFALKLNLIGTSPRPVIDPSWRDLTGDDLQQLKASTMIAARKSGESAPKAWEKLQRDLEIDRTLQAFQAAGIQTTYYQCNVADRAALSQTLEQIRDADGPIEGVLHGAGIDRSCRFERKQRDVVSQTIGAKVDGAAHLMALTKADPVRHFLGFGSISGRLGSFGQTDYCLASDMLCKLIGAYRRERPWIQATGFHWHPWDGVGMAARPETKNVLQEQSQLHLMPLNEGITHLIRELEAGLPEPELLITERRHWDRFAAGLGQLSKSRSGADSTGSVPTQGTTSSEPATSTEAADTPAPSVASPVDDDLELLTHRCAMRIVPAPLPADAPTACSFPGSVWILGDNALATSLQQRLAQAGVDVWQIPTTASIDETTTRMQQKWSVRPASHLFLLTGRDAVNLSLADDQQILLRESVGVVLPFFVTQQWYKLLQGHPDVGVADLVAAVSLGGDFGFGGSAVTPDGGSMCGLLKAIHIEDSRREQRTVRCKVMDSPAGDSPDEIINAMLRELAASEPEVEVSWSKGQRNVVRPLPTALPTRKPGGKDPHGGTWVVTGGARGITAIAARGLAQKFGWKLHLFGVSPAPQEDAAWRNYTEAEMKSLKTQLAREAVSQGRSPSEAWDRVMKDVEIFDNLKKFSEAGISTTYHQCDISDRNSVARCLDEVRTQDGPIRGVLHGAGLIDPGRFESKRPGFVGKLIAAKYRGLLNLISLMPDDPLDFCIGFGSISGRFGGNGLTDYAAGNDVMAKVIDWIRQARPGCAATCVHWESWEGSGMATLPRFAWGPKAVMNMKYMTPEEGLYRMQQELEAGLPESEVLYTFGDFYPMFFPNEQRPLGPFQPGKVTSDAAAGGEQSLVRAIRKIDDRHVGDFPLDPAKDAFLIQHRLRDKPLLPVVVGLEALAEAAAAASAKHLVGFHDVQMLDGLMFHTDNPLTAHVEVFSRDENLSECRLVCDFRNRSGGLIQKDRLYLKATARLASNVQYQQATINALPEAWTEFGYPEDAEVYHGPAFRGVSAFSFDQLSGWGRITALPVFDLVGDSRADGWILPSCVLDAAFYACGIHLWMHGDQAISLPRQIDQLDLGRQPQPGQVCLSHFVCREIGEKSATYDFTVIDPEGYVVVAARGYQKVILSRGGGPR